MGCVALNEDAKVHSLSLAAFFSFSIKIGVYVLEKCTIKIKASTYKRVTVGWACWRINLFATSSKGEHAPGDKCILCIHYNPKGVVVCPAWHYGAKPVRDVNQQKDYKIMGVAGLWKHRLQQWWHRVL